MTTCPVLLLEDRYRLDARIGSGAMGEVWRATDVALNRPVAVKLLRPALARHEDDLARFRAEARSAASVPHVCVVQVYDYCEDDCCGRPYLVMELVDGTSLDRLLDSGPLGAAFTMDIVAQAALGLAAAHEAGLVHRDVKPQNLLVTRSGQVKITDFGIARAADSARVTRAGMMLGTPAYLAPERALGQAGTPASDLYALGIVAYRCLAGRLPFTGEPLAVMLAHHHEPLPPLPPSVPTRVAALVAHLTAKDPQARPASAAQVAAQAAELHAALAAKATRPGPLAAGPAGTAGQPLLAALGGTIRPGKRGRAGRRHSRHPLAVAGRAGLALAGVGAIGLTSWMLAHASVSAPHDPPPPPAAITGPPGIHPAGAAVHRHHRGTAARRARSATSPAIAPPYQGPSLLAGRSTPSRTAAPKPSSPGPGRTPTSSPRPGGTPTPTSSPPPGGTPTPTSSPSPGGTPTSSPSPGGTPTASASSRAAS